MELPKDGRILAVAGVATALVAGIAVAYLFGAGKRESETPPPASQGGLVVEVAAADAKLDPSRKLPCYVGGQSVGMTTLTECARRNGITSGQLDVGIDQTGAMAYGEASAALTPLPPTEIASATPAPLPAPQAPAVRPAAPASSPRGPTATCWRYVERTWLKMTDMPLGACVAALFDGQCERPGGATYGRWGEQTLRLVPGRIEQSSDNRTFRTLAEQGTNCSVPPLQ